MTSTNDQVAVRRQKVLPSHTTIFLLIALAILTLGILQPRLQYKRKLDVSRWTSFQSSYHPVIAIDLGETYTRAALYKAGRIDMIIDHEGSSNIPSACSIWSQVPGSSRRWLNGILQTPLSLFKQDENINLDIDWPPQARTLKHIKDLAFKQTGQKFADVILAIQAHANDTERQSLTDAASLAGLTTLRIVNASQAAVMGYGLDKKGGESTAVVIDVGASGLRISLMALDDGVFGTLAETGNETLGGNAYTERIVEWLGVSPGAENRMEVLLEAERIKHMMSDVINELGVGKNHLSRKDFESITQDLVDGLSASMDQTLLLAGQNKSNIDFVVVTGGTSKLPQIRSAIKAYFGRDSRILTGLDQPEEAAARGIANLIPILGDDHECDNFLEDNPVGVGIETSGGLFEAIVPRFYYLPSRMSKNFTVSYSQDVPTIIRVYEGVRRLVQDNRPLAEFKLPHLEPGSNITVILQRDSDFLTHVTVQTPSGLLIERARIELATNSSDILLKNEEMLRDLEDHDITREKINSRVIELQQYTLYSMDLLVYSNNIETDHQRDQIERLSEVVDWISTYATNCTLDEVDERLGQARAVMGGADGLPLVF